MDKVLSNEVAEETSVAEKGADNMNNKNLDESVKVTAGKLVVEEELHEGRVSWAAREYLPEPQMAKGRISLCEYITRCNVSFKHGWFVVEAILALLPRDNVCYPFHNGGTDLDFRLVDERL